MCRSVTKSTSKWQSLSTCWRRYAPGNSTGVSNECIWKLILRLKGSTPQLNQIAREVALDLGDAAFRPDIVSHTPGIASTIADDLSRRFCPGTVFKLPTLLENVARSTPQQQRQLMVEIDIIGRGILEIVGPRLLHTARTSCVPCFSHVFITSRNSVLVTALATQWRRRWW